MFSVVCFFVLFFLSPYHYRRCWPSIMFPHWSTWAFKVTYLVAAVATRGKRVARTRLVSPAMFMISACGSESRHLFVLWEAIPHASPHGCFKLACKASWRALRQSASYTVRLSFFYLLFLGTLDIDLVRIRPPSQRTQHAEGTCQVWRALCLTRTWTPAMPSASSCSSQQCFDISRLSISALF